MSETKKPTNYKYCIVPMCESTSVSTPNKLFINLPTDKEMRLLWQNLMGRKDFVTNKGSKYCCEDHFNLEEDLENYLYLKLMKTGRVKLKPGVVPHIFKCQDDRSYEENEIPTSTKMMMVSDVAFQVSSDDTALDIDIKIEPGVVPHIFKCQDDNSYEDNEISTLSTKTMMVSDVASQFSSDDTTLDIDIKIEENSLFWESGDTRLTTDNDDKSFQVDLVPSQNIVSVNSDLEVDLVPCQNVASVNSDLDIKTEIKTEDIFEYSEYDATLCRTMLKTESDQFIQVDLVPIQVTNLTEDNLTHLIGGGTSRASVSNATSDKCIQVNLVPKRRSKAIQCNLPLPKVKRGKRKYSNR